MILDALFPNRCLNCDRIINSEELVCGICFDQINFTHWKFDEKNPLKQKCNLLFPVENTFALMQFEQEGISRKIIHELKYKGREKIGKTLAKWTKPFLIFENAKPDLLISIPLHPKKMRKRGYNQLHLFTETLSKIYEIPFDHDALKRNYYKKAQAKKGKEERSHTENLFSLNKNIENKHLLVIDDVYTTGNTMNSAVWELLKKGNNKVSVLVMAVD